MKTTLTPRHTREGSRRWYKLLGLPNSRLAHRGAYLQYVYSCRDILHQDERRREILVSPLSTLCWQDQIRAHETMGAWPFTPCTLDARVRVLLPPHAHRHRIRHVDRVVLPHAEPQHASACAIPRSPDLITLVLQAVDPLTAGGIVTLTWWIDSDSCVAEGGNAATCPPVNFYMDPNIFAGQYATPQQPASNGIPSVPTFQLFAPTDWRNPLARYTTQLAVATRTYRPSDTLLNYPFDRYVTEVVAYAQVNGTNEYVGLNVVQATGVAFGFDTVVPSAARILKDFGIPAGPEGVQGGPNGSLQLPLEIRRTILVQACVVSLILAMWLITLCLLGIVIKATFLRYEVDVAILVAPVATLFACTTLCQAMPGSPSGFGAIIDFVGTLPSLAVLIAITVVCLFHAHRNKDTRLEECKCRSDK